MKKTILLVLVVLGTYTAVEGQEQFRFGVKAGFTIADYSGPRFEGFESEESRTAYQLGLLAEIPLSSRFRLQPELLYSAQGFDLKTPTGQTHEFDLDYLMLPLLVEFRLTKGLGILAGPQVGYLLDNDRDALQADGERLIYNYNSFDLSLGFGAEYHFRELFFYGRYNAGVNQIVNDSRAQSRNSVFQAGIGFMF